MSTVSATKFGAQQEYSIYGDYLKADDGEGLSHGEMVEETTLDNRIVDIQAMRSEMGRSPQLGDERVAELLDFDEILIRNGLVNGDYNLTLDMYPDLSSDLPEYMAKIAREDPQVYARISQELGHEDGARWFVEAPIELLAELERTQSSAILEVLLDGVTAHQVSTSSQRRHTTTV